DAAANAASRRDPQERAGGRAVGAAVTLLADLANAVAADGWLRGRRGGGWIAGGPDGRCSEEKHQSRRESAGRGERTDHRSDDRSRCYHGASSGELFIRPEAFEAQQESGGARPRPTSWRSR